MTSLMLMKKNGISIIGRITISTCQYTLRKFSSGELIHEKVLGEEHPDTAITLRNLANFYKRQGKYDEAERLTSGRWRSTGDV